MTDGYIFANDARDVICSAIDESKITGVKVRSIIDRWRREGKHNYSPTLEEIAATVQGLDDGACADYMDLLIFSDDAPVSERP